MRSQGLPTILVVIIAFLGFGFLLYQNSQPTAPLRVVVPTQVEPTAEANTWQNILRPGFGAGGTPRPTVPIPQQTFAAPTLMAPDGSTATPVDAAQLADQSLYTLAPVSVGATPTRIAPTLPATSEDNEDIPVGAVWQAPTIPWQPPSLNAPLSLDPLGRDHYFLWRPVDASGQNFGSYYYPYGSDGVEFSANRIHHGVDMPNPIGAPIRAAGSGTVIFASNEESGAFQGSVNYGQVVFIEHDFGWQGQPIYTLYAHLQAPLVQTGDTVQPGQAIGLNGESGRASGPHVHFEIRVGGDRYGDTYNPVLWLVPYVGHGTIAGRLVDADGNFIDDAVITLRDWSTGLQVQSTTTYIFDGTVNQVNSDPDWGENFVFGDIPVGRYEVVALANGERVTQIVDVVEGMTVFADLSQDDPQEIVEESS